MRETGLTRLGRYWRRLKRTLRPRPPWGADDAPWGREVRYCQAIISEASPHPHYLAAYRDQEAWYWHHIAQWIYADAQQMGAARGLDIGCAYGTLALYCRRAFGCEMYCTDFTDRFFTPALAREHGLTFVQHNIELDPLPWNLRFDAIVFTEVLEHLNFHPVATLRRIADALTAGGRLYLSTPDAAEWGLVTKYYRSLRELPAARRGAEVIDDHVHHYDREELCEVLEAAGPQVERLAYAEGVVNRHLNISAVRRQPAVLLCAPSPET